MENACIQNWSFLNLDPDVIEFEMLLNELFCGFTTGLI